MRASSQQKRLYALQYSRDKEDSFAAATLVDEFQTVRKAPAKLVKSGPVRIGRYDQPEIKEALSRLKIDRAVFDQYEGYVLHANRDGIVLGAKTAAGAFYGVQTLRQLLRNNGGSISAPAITIVDWPALRYRGLSLDVSRGPVPTGEQLMLVIRTLAEFKLNVLSFYAEHVIPYTASPGVAPDGGELSHDLLRRVSAYAAQHHISILPQQQTFAHLHHMLKLERYADMAEVPHGSVIAAEDKLAYREAWLSENRPYWLDNVLVRYEHEALYWHSLSRKLEEVGQQYRAEKALPDPVSLGLHLQP